MALPENIDKMNLSDFLRHQTTVNGHRQIVLTVLPDGRYQASILRADGVSWCVDIHSDPVDALWNVLVPYNMRRTDPAKGNERYPVLPWVKDKTTIEIIDLPAQAPLPKRSIDPVKEKAADKLFKEAFGEPAPDLDDLLA